MVSEYKTILEGKTGELIEKKSRFIAHVSPVQTEEEATAFIEAIRKEHWGARHNCYAYVIGEQSQLQRFSDDGEPSQTAGKPILDVLLGAKLHDTLIVVTRYFGGTLLGTGGLVRAYSGAAKAGLEASKVITKIHGYKYRIDTDYTGHGKVQYILLQHNIPILDTAYTDAVSVQAVLSDAAEGKIIAEITEGTNGKAQITREDECYFAESEGQTLIFT